jgi:hypothetical protein
LKTTFAAEIKASAFLFLAFGVRFPDVSEMSLFAPKPFECSATPGDRFRNRSQLLPSPERIFSHLGFALAVACLATHIAHAIASHQNKLQPRGLQGVVCLPKLAGIWE